MREGHYESAFVERQAEKVDPEQPCIASILPRFEPAAGSVEMIVVGCGPAGLALAAEVASHGVSVALLGMWGHHVWMCACVHVWCWETVCMRGGGGFVLMRGVCM